MKKVLIGIQPTGSLHVGNYLGVIKEGLALQNQFDVTFMIATYHAEISLPKEEVESNSRELIDILKKLGARKIVKQDINTRLFLDVINQTKATELGSIFSTGERADSAGVFTYPALMAHDIILARANFVVVGADQEKHMELYRDVCRRLGIKEASTINSKYYSVKSIKDPTKKMSKSLGDNHCIYLTDSEDVIIDKLKSSPTTEPGLINLTRLADAFGVKFDRKKCNDSKIILAKAIAKEFEVLRNIDKRAKPKGMSGLHEITDDAGNIWDYNPFSVGETSFDYVVSRSSDTSTQQTGSVDHVVMDEIEESLDNSQSDGVQLFNSSHMVQNAEGGPRIDAETLARYESLLRTPRSGDPISNTEFRVWHDGDSNTF